MPLTIVCNACSAKSKIPDALYEARFAGKKSKIRCKKCGEQIEVDGTDGAPKDDPQSLGLLAHEVTSSMQIECSTPMGDGPELDASRDATEATSAVNAPASARTESEQALADKSNRVSQNRDLASSLRSHSPLTLRAVALSNPEAEATSESEQDERTVVEASALTEVSGTNSSAAPSEAEATPEPSEHAARSRVSRASIQNSAKRQRRSLAVYATVFTTAVVFGVALSSVAKGRGALPTRSVAGTSLPEPQVERQPQAIEPSVPSEVAEPSASAVPTADLPERAPPAEPERKQIELPKAAAYDEQALARRLRWFAAEADACHRGGRAAGTAKIVITFAPNGKVKEARIEGEPIASAPVGRCVLSVARSIILPRFSGEPFTVTREFTLH